MKFNIIVNYIHRTLCELLPDQIIESEQISLKAARIYCTSHRQIMRFTVQDYSDMNQYGRSIIGTVRIDSFVGGEWCVAYLNDSDLLDHEVVATKLEHVVTLVRIKHG